MKSTNLSVLIISSKAKGVFFFCLKWFVQRVIAFKSVLKAAARIM